MDSLVSVTLIKDKFEFVVESTGVMKPELIMKSAFEVLILKLKDI